MSLIDEAKKKYGTDGKNVQYIEYASNRSNNQDNSTTRSSLLSEATAKYGTDGKNTRYIDYAMRNGGGNGGTSAGIVVDDSGGRYYGYSTESTSRGLDAYKAALEKLKEKPAYGGAKEDARAVLVGQNKSSTGAIRVRNTINAGAAGSAASYTNLAGTAGEGLKRLNDAAYTAQHNQQYIAAQNSRDYWKSVLEDLSSSEEMKKRAKTAYDMAVRNMKSIEDGMAQQTKDLQGAYNKAYAKADELQEKSNAYTQIAKEGLGGFGQLLVDAGVNATQMAGDAALNAVAPGAGLWALGARSFGSATQEARQDGATYGQQLLYGGLNAATEVLTEKMFDGLAGIYGKSALADTKLAANVGRTVEKVLGKLPTPAKKIIESMGGEAIEELVAGAIEPAYQYIYGGEGYDEDTVSDIINAMLVGGMLGGLGGGVSVVGTNVNNSAQYAPDAATAQELVDYALELDPENKTAQRANARLQRGKNIGGGTVTSLLEQNQNAEIRNDKAAIQSAVEQQLTQYGEQGDIPAIAEAITRKTTGERISGKEMDLIANSQYGQRVVNELNPDNIEGEGFNSDWTGKIGTKRINADTYGRLVQQEENGETAGEEAQQERVIENKTLKDAVASTKMGGMRVTESTVNSVMQDPQAMAELGVVTEGKTEAEQKQAVKVALKASASSHTMPQVYTKQDFIDAAASKYGAQAGAFKAIYQNGQDVAKFDEAYGNVREYAMGGASLDAIRDLNSVKYLTDEQIALAYDTAVAESNEKALKASPKAGNGKPSVRRKGSAKLGGVKYRSLNTQQKRAVNIVRRIAEATGIDVVMYESRAGEDGKFRGEEGKFVWSENKIYIDLNSGIMKMSQKGDVERYTALRTFTHEFVHFTEKWNPVQYNELRRAVFDAMDKKMAEDGSEVNHTDLVNKKLDLYRAEVNPDFTYEQASREVVADSLTDVLQDSTFVENLYNEHRSLFNKLVEKLKEFVDNIKAYFADVTTSSKQEAALLKEEADGTMKYLQSIVDTFDKVAAGAVENYQAAQDIGMDIDTETESVNPEQFNLRTWTESEYVQERENAAKEISNAIGIDIKKAKAYIDDVNSIAKAIADDKVRLDYNETGLSPFISNVEYGGSFDYTTLCKKRRLLTGTFSAIQKALPNTALTAQEILDIRKMMDDAGLEVRCGKCYVEGSRANMGKFTKQFIELYKKYNPGAWYPNMAEMNTPDGIEWVRVTHPEVYEQYEYFWNHYGTLKPGDPNLFASQQKPKLYQMRSAYNGEILKHFKSDDKAKIDEKNINGGIRMQSFSDFEIVHLIDAMQTIMDMSRVGLNGQAYTKVPDFAWALGDTGLKINLSIDAWSVDENGKLVFNNKEGMPFDTAMDLRNAYSKNVGTICCVYDDAQLLAAMADDRIDFIIPFHRSQWKKAQYKAMGLPQTTKDYTYQQNEKWLDPSKHTHEYRGRQVKDKCHNYMPNEYWDFNLSGKENAERYLAKCAEDGKRPKFYKFLDKNADGSFSLKKDGSTDGYWKLLIDFKMYDNDGVGSPQMPVRPNFNMEQCHRMINEYEGGHEKFPVANGIVDEFVSKYKEDHNGVQYEVRRWDNGIVRKVVSKRNAPITYEIVKNKAHELDELNRVIYVSSSEIEEAVNRYNLFDGNDMDYLKIIAKEAIKGEVFNLNVNGSKITAVFTDDGGEHLKRFNTKTPERIAIVEKFRDAINNSEYIYSSYDDGHEGAKNVDVWDHFLAGVDVEKDGKHEMYTILLGLRKMKNEADHQIKAVNIKDANFARATLRTDNGGGHAIYSGSEFASSKKIISQTGAESQENSSKQQKSVRNNSDISVDAESGDAVSYSVRVTDKDMLDFLNKQIKDGDYVTVYRSFQVIDGGLYAPMNAVDRDANGKNKRLGYRSEIGKWEMATESPEIAQRYMDSHPGAKYAKFDLDGVDNKTGGVAYNPYLHASNLVLNDQFSAAYRRNLVTVECRVPLSEANGAYKAQYAKDATGFVEWKPGGVAGKLMKVKPEFTRKLFVSRYMMPVRIMPESEVAQMYKEYLDGTDISVNWNVVTPKLRTELEKAGVSVSYNDIKAGGKTIRFSDAVKQQYAVRDNGDRTEDNLNALKKEQADIEEQLDLAYVNDLSDTEIRRLENRLTKVEADISKIVAEERKASVLTPMQTILDNLQNYRMTDLYSLAEQVSDGAWDGYEDLSREDLEDALRESIEERELSPLEMQTKKFGLYVRPVAQYQIRESNLSNRDVLGMAAKAIERDDTRYGSMNAADRDALKVFRKRLDALNDAQAMRQNLLEQKRGILDGREAKELSKEERSELRKVQNNLDTVNGKIKRAEADLMKVENTAITKKILKQARNIVDKDARQRGRENLREYRQKRTSNELRNKIGKMANDFRQMILHPTDSRYAPIGLMQSCLDVAMMLDTSGAREDTKAKAKFNSMMEALTSIQDQYNALKTNGDSDYRSEYDPEFAYMVDQLRQHLAGKPVRELTVTELQDIHDIMHDIKHMLQDAKFQLGKADKITNYSVGESIIRQQKSVKPRTTAEKAMDATFRQTGSTLRNIRRIAQYDDSSALVKLFNDLNEGIKKKNRFMMECDKMFEQYVGERFHKAASDVIAYDTGKRTIEMTEMEAIQFVLSWEREMHGKTNHMMEGGVIIPDHKLLKKGKVDDAFAKGVTYANIEESEVMAVARTFDAWAVGYKDTAKKFFNDNAKNAINEATVQIKHRPVAVSEDYIPFRVAKNSVPQEMEGVKFDATIEGMGMLKSVVEGASNPIELYGLHNVIEDHINKAGQVYGLAVPIRNINKALNIKQIGTADMTPLKAITIAWNSGDAKLIMNALTDLQTPRKLAEGVIPELFRKAQGKFVEATLLSNISVTIKQAASYSTAGLYLSQKALAPYQGTIAKLFANNNSKYAKDLFAEIDAHTPEHYIRRKGMSMQEISTVAQDQSKVVRWMDDKLPDAANPLKWIQNMDVATTGALWLASKKQVELDGTKPTDDGYWEKVTALYEQVIEETQPMYDVLHRPEVQKTASDLVRSIIMFRTQPLQNSGILYDAVGELSQAKKSGSKADIAKAQKKMRNAAGSQIASLAVFATMTMIAYAVRNRMGRYKDDEEELTVQSVVGRILGDMAGNAAQLAIPLGGDVVSGFIEKRVTGSNYGGEISVPVIDRINDYISDFNSVWKDFADYDDGGRDKLAKDVSTFSQDVAGLFGIPASNVMNIFKGVVGNVTDIAGHPISWATDVSTPNVGVVKTMYDNGHADKAKAKIKEIIQNDVAEGKTEAEATKSVKSGLSGYWKDQYIDAAGSNDSTKLTEIRKLMKDSGVFGGANDIVDTCYKWMKNSIQSDYEDGVITDSVAVSQLAKYAGKSRQEAEVYVAGWKFNKEHSDLDWTDAQIKKYNSEVKQQGISVNEYDIYLNQLKNCTGRDADGDGKTDSGSKKAQVLALIDSMNLTNAQKDFLYYQEGYKASTIHEAPWH